MPRSSGCGGKTLSCGGWAFSALTWSPGARANYDRRRAVGDHHNAALRNVANKLVGRMWWCLSHNEKWEQATAWAGAEPAAA